MQFYLSNLLYFLDKIDNIYKLCREILRFCLLKKMDADRTDARCVILKFFFNDDGSHFEK